MTLDDSSVDTSSLPVLKPSPNYALRYFACTQVVLLTIGCGLAAGVLLQLPGGTADGEQGEGDIAVTEDYFDTGPPGSPDSGAGDMIFVEQAAGAASSSNG